MDVTGFDWRKLNAEFIRNPENRAEDYGITIAQTDRKGVAWRCIGVYHLTPEENGRRHNIFIDVLNESGQRVSNARITWGWDDTPHDLRLAKPDNEPAGDIPIFAGANIWLHVSREFGDGDKVLNIRSTHRDEGTGNTLGHHSFYVVFQRRVVQVDPPVIPPIDPPVSDDWESRLQRLERAMYAMAKELA